jgi:hypothetical protein
MSGQRDEKGLWKPGQSGNAKGRPSGLVELTAIRDAILKPLRDNPELLAKDLEDLYLLDPIRYLKTLVYPFFPKDPSVLIQVNNTVETKSDKPSAEKMLSDIKNAIEVPKVPGAPKKKPKKSKK